eukprot:Sdes_comp9450_c0_seq1m915
MGRRQPQSTPRGPGRKSRKQGDPVIADIGMNCVASKDNKMKKGKGKGNFLKKNSKIQISKKDAKFLESKQELFSESEEEILDKKITKAKSNAFSDDNRNWLKLKDSHPNSKPH